MKRLVTGFRRYPTDPYVRDLHITAEQLRRVFLILAERTLTSRSWQHDEPMGIMVEAHGIGLLAASCDVTPEQFKDFLRRLKTFGKP